MRVRGVPSSGILFYHPYFLKKKSYVSLKKYIVVHRFDACPRAENKLINANFPYRALSQQLLPNYVFASPLLA